MRGRGSVVAAVALVVCAALVIDCRPSARAPAVTEAVPAPHAEAVVLVTIDGVRWQEIFDGVDTSLSRRPRAPGVLLPNLRRLFFEEGTVIGDPRLGGGIEGSAPRHMSMPGYVEISTGAGTACADNDCRPALGETIADAAATAGGGAAVFGSWSEIARAAAARPDRVFVQAGAAPGRPGRPLGGGEAYAPDAVTAEEALAYLRDKRPRFLWVALGDTDEWAHAGEYDRYVEALQAADRFLGDLAGTLGAMGERGARTAIFVTADHGRDPGFRSHGGPPSAAVWLLSRGPGIARRGAIGTDRQWRLRDVAPTVREVLGLPARRCDGCGRPIDEIVAAR